MGVVKHSTFKTQLLNSQFTLKSRNAIILLHINNPAYGKSLDTQEIDLFVEPKICDPLISQIINTCSKMYSHLAQLDISPEMTLEVDMLIGSDIY